MTELQTLLQEIIGNKSRKEVANNIKMTAGYVTQILSGQTIPSDEAVASIAVAYAPARLGELLGRVIEARIESGFEGKSELQRRVLEEFTGRWLTTRPSAAGKEHGRTFNDFPEAFYPLVVVTGDKREDSDNWISPADFGTKAATPADIRWIMNLGLAKDVIVQIDKNFVLLPEDQLIERFSQVNLLVIGSPAANHLARRLNPESIFRFNYSKARGEFIEQLIEEARRTDKEKLRGLLASRKTGQENLIRSLFQGGIVDPTHPDEFAHAGYWAVAENRQLDWGLLSFAPNPFYARRCERENRSNDHRYVSIVAAGIHHPGTAHAVRQLGVERRESGAFRLHPYGGVIRVDMDPKLAFANRVESARCTWEDDHVGGDAAIRPQKERIISGLERMVAELSKPALAHLEITSEQAHAGIELLDRL